MSVGAMKKTYRNRTHNVLLESSNTYLVGEAKAVYNKKGLGVLLRGRISAGESWKAEVAKTHGIEINGRIEINRRARWARRTKAR